MTGTDASEPIHAETAEVVLPAGDLQATLAFYRECLGFRLETIFPADAPRVAVVSGHGLRLRLERGHEHAPVRLRLRVADAGALVPEARELVDAGGNRIALVGPQEAPALRDVEPELLLTRAQDQDAWSVGRAGMRYRDLIPGRLGGRAIASQIRILEGGPVPDDVHHHAVRFQIIYCRRGSVRVVYEDQGEPFLLRAGDCVLQPPHIRHRVLESAGGLEVIEVGAPAEHATCLDHELALPNEMTRPQRGFSGQRFVRHVAEGAPWSPWRVPGFECRETGVGAASGGVGEVCVARPTPEAAPATVQHDAELAFLFVLDGTVTLRSEGRGPERLVADDALVVPAGLRHAFVAPSPDLELLEVRLPAAVRTERASPALEPGPA